MTIQKEAVILATMEIIMASIGIGCWIIAAMILVHHKHKHSNVDDTQNLLPENEQWFQNKDVCVIRCTHENWAVLFIMVGTASVCASIIAVIVDTTA